MKNIIRYIVTDVVSIPVFRIGNKGEIYRMATGAGWGVVEWYGAANDYKMPVIRDRSDKTQVLCCDEDTSAVLYPHTLKYGYGAEFVISPYAEINLKDAPSQAQTDVIIISDCSGFNFWAKDDTDVKIFVTYDENGLIDSYRLDNWTGKPYDGEIEITFNDLQSEAEHDMTNRADIKGTFEYFKRVVMPTS